MTLDELISELQHAREHHGGGASIFIKDQDTGWHLEPTGVRESNNKLGRLLLTSETYSDYMSRRQS